MSKSLGALPKLFQNDQPPTNLITAISFVKYIPIRMQGFSSKLSRDRYELHWAIWHGFLLHFFLARRKNGNEHFVHGSIEALWRTEELWVVWLNGPFWGQELDGESWENFGDKDPCWFDDSFPLLFKVYLLCRVVEVLPKKEETILNVPI